jgi:hypothetical protein
MEGAMAAQAAHSFCPKYSFLLRGHNPPYSAIGGFPVHLVLFLIGIVSKNSERRKRCDVTAVY